MLGSRERGTGRPKGGSPGLGEERAQCPRPGHRGGSAGTVSGPSCCKAQGPLQREHRRLTRLHPGEEVTTQGQVPAAHQLGARGTSPQLACVLGTRREGRLAPSARERNPNRIGMWLSLASSFSSAQAPVPAGLTEHRGVRSPPSLTVEGPSDAG